MARTVVKKRIGPEGKEIPCEEDASAWVDIKENKKVPYERGRGQAYQKTVYTHCENSERRTYEDEPKITFKNPDNENQKIEYTKDKGRNHGIIKTLYSEAGRGRYYQKTRIHFCNGEDTTRKTREQRVENEETGDHIQVERIKRFSNDWARGFAYQKKHVHPCNSEQSIKNSEGPCKSVPEGA